MSRDFQPITGKQHKEQGIFRTKDKIIIGFVLTAVIMLVVFWNKILDSILVPFTWLFGSVKPTSEEKQKYKQLLKIKVERSKLTISETEARSRADLMYRAMQGLGTKPFELMRAIIQKEYWPEVDKAKKSLDDIGVLWYEEFDGLVSKYHRYEDQVALSKTDYILIAQKFGIRNGRTGWYTLTEYLTGDDDGELLALYKYAYRGTPIIF